MKVYLTKDVKKIGTKGQLVTVSEGFGRNYLLAQGLASVRQVAGRAKQTAPAISKSDLQRLRELKTPLQIGAAANKNGTLYQAVTVGTISSELRKQLHVHIRPEFLTIAAPVKSLGVFDCAVTDHGTEHTRLTCEVVASH